MNYFIKYLLFLFFSQFIFLSNIFAGGPLNIAGTNNSIPVIYDNGGRDITLNFDQGGLGGRSNTRADTLVNQAIDLWNNVSTATISLNQGDDLSQDINDTNFSSLLNKFTDGINPVIYDSDGSIVDALFGAGAHNTVLGFAGSGYSSSTARYTEGQMVINGAIAVSDTTFLIVFAHEMGHLFGLDHTQLDGTQGLSTSNYALMYPTAYRTRLSLHEDEVSSLTSLYPSTDAQNFYGELTGVFINTDTTAILGANIWAKNTDNGQVFSYVSDYLKQSTGYFRLLLPPGNYTLHAESIQSNFHGSARVGPYANSTISASFRAPHPITPVVFQEGTVNTPYEISIAAGCETNITFQLDGMGFVGSDSCGNDLPLTIHTNELQSGTIDIAYQIQLMATGGVLPYQWDVINGSLPPGLNLETTTGEINGSPVTAGNYNFTIQLQDSLASIQSRNLSLNIYASQTIGDNRDANTERTGTWLVSSGASPWNGESLFSDNNGSFRWFTELPSAGSYEVYAWWTYHPNRSTNVPYRIQHAAGIDTVYVNQKDTSLGGQWILLGTYNFAAGNSAYIEVSSENGQASADAVRFAQTSVASNNDSDNDGMPDDFELNNGLDPSNPADADFDLDGDGLNNLSEYQLGTDVLVMDVTAPNILPAGGSFDIPVQITLTTATTNASIYYTLDGSTPTTASSLYSTPFLLNVSATVSAKAFRNGYTDSLVSTANFTITLPQMEEIVIDNRDTNTTRIGTWSASSGVNPWDNESLFNNGNGSFRWLPEIPNSGSYEVYAWWTYHINRSSNVPYRIQHADGIDTVYVNQRDIALGGQWVLLGTYHFTAGNSDYIEVSSENGQASADAVRFSQTSVAGNNDSDNDGMPDNFELSNGLDPSNPADADFDLDGDGLNNLSEYQLGTDVLVVDAIAPNILPAGGSFDTPVEITLTTATTNASIYYTLDGSTPTTTSQLYSTPFLLNASATVNAKAFRNGYTDSLVSTADFSITLPATEIIIDNRDLNTARTGTWNTSSGVNPWDNESLYNNGNGSFRWVAEIPNSGSYEVYAWWTYHINRSSNVPYRIQHSTGIHTDYVNQRDTALGGQWVLLGTYHFTAGESAYVEVSGENGQASADAIRFTKM